jgi:hypothetical protein
MRNHRLFVGEEDFDLETTMAVIAGLIIICQTGHQKEWPIVATAPPAK